MTYPTRYPAARWRPIPINHSEGGMVHPTRGLIPHVQMGTSPLFGWFSSASAGVSSHLWLGRDGEMDQYVDFGDKAWTQGAGNPFWISVECAGRDTDDYTDIQVQRLGELFAWGMRELGWRAQVTDSPAGYGLGTHRMGGTAWGGHSCPGDIRARRRGDILDVATRTAVAASTAGWDRYAGRPTLREGSRGRDVVEVQNALNIIFGHEAPTGDPNRITPDGDYGPRTRARVASLQRHASPWAAPIPDDGICGPNTWRKAGYILTGMGRRV